MPAMLWWGLETPINRLIDFCQDDEECVAMIKAELAKEPMGDIGGENNPKGLNQHSNEIGQVDTVNLTKEPKGGNNKSYLLRRLAKESKAGN